MVVPPGYSGPRRVRWMKAKNTTSTHPTSLPAENSTSATIATTSTATTTTTTTTTMTTTIVSAKPDDYGTAEEHGTLTAVVAVIFVLIVLMLILGSALWYRYKKRRGPERLVGAFGVKDAIYADFPSYERGSCDADERGLRGRVIYTID